MADIKPTAPAAAKTATSAQPKKSSNLVATIAPIACILFGYILWRFVIGADSNFTTPDATGGFWPSHKGPKGALAKMYEGGIIVPILIGALLIVISFCIERMLTITKANGTGDIAEFVRSVQFHLANRSRQSFGCLRQAKRICWKCYESRFKEIQRNDHQYRTRY